ncbi:MAG: ATP-binding protein [Leptolyngbyaceae cyanobacterium]
MTTPPIYGIRNFLVRLKSWLKPLKVIHKIGLGYALVAGVAITGTVTGVAIAQRHQQRAYQGNEDAVEEILRIKRIENAITRFISHERKLIIWIDDPEEFLANYDLYRDSAEDFEHEWNALLSEYREDIAAGVEETDAELALLDDLIETYGDAVENNLTEIDRFVQELDFDTLQGERLIQARQAFIDLNRRASTTTLERFEIELSEFASFIEQDEIQEAQEVIETSGRLQLQIVILSVVLSLLAAGLLAYAISRTIVRPLKAVQETALNVVQDDNFHLRAAVVNSDEISSLAQSLNQLIEWVGEYTYALKTTQQDLENQAHELNAIIDNLGDGLLVIDARGTITRSNPVLEQMFRLEGMTLKGMAVDAVFDQQIIELVAQNQAYPQRSLRAEVNLLNQHTGQALVTDITADEPAIKSSQGTVVLIRDITDKKEVEQMKTDFLSTVSHELRTPLTSILGFAKLIQKKLPDTLADTGKADRTMRTVQRNLSIILSEGERLTLLINDVLDISKIEAGKINWALEPTSMTTVIESAISTMSVLARDHGLALTADIAPEMPLVMCDLNRLIQVVINLISNAIKFTDSGSVVCRVYRQQTHIITSVIDTGIGLSPRDIDKVFEKFTQVGEIMTDKPKGTGLGLSICKQIIEHHGGRIWAESKLGQGSTFSFSLPARLPQEPPKL